VQQIWIEEVTVHTWSCSSRDSWIMVVNLTSLASLVLATLNFLTTWGFFAILTNIEKMLKVKLTRVQGRYIARLNTGKLWIFIMVRTKKVIQSQLIIQADILSEIVEDSIWHYQSWKILAHKVHTGNNMLFPHCVFLMHFQK